MNKEIVMPNFDDWADNLIKRIDNLLSPREFTVYQRVGISNELYDAFQKGYALGRRIEQQKNRRDRDEQ